MKSLVIRPRRLIRCFVLAFCGVSLLKGATDPSDPPAAAYQAGLSTAPLRRLDERLARADSSARERRELEDALIAMLQPEATVEARLFACQRLAVVGSDRCLPALEVLLRSPETVGMACLALANLPSAKADAVLRQVLPELQGVSLVQVVTTLGRRRDTGSVPALTRLVTHNDAAVAQAATLALARVANRAARRTLATLRREPRPPVAAVLDEAALLEAEALVARRDTKAARRLYEGLILPSHPDHVRAGALGALLDLESSRVEDRILSILDGSEPALLPDEPLRPVAIAAIGRLTTARAGLTFAGLLDRLPAAEQVLLIQALGDLGPHTPRSALAAQLKSAVPSVRLAVIRAFARIGDPADVPTFAEALARAETAEERRLAESALLELPGGSTTDQALLAELRAASSPTRASLLAVLARRGSQAAIPVLFAGASDPEPLVARAGLQGLGRVGTPAEVPALIDLYAGLPPGAVRDDAEAALVRILERMPDAAGRTQTICAKLEAARSPEARLAILRLLPLAGGEPALRAARAAASAPDESVRDAGVRALADWPSSDAADDLIVLYRESQVPAHQSLALRGLARLAREANASPTPALVERYRQVLDAARSDDDRRFVLGALGGCVHPDALALALEQRGHTAVRVEADQTARRIAEALKATHPQPAEAALKMLAE